MKVMFDTNVYISDIEAACIEKNWKGGGQSSTFPA